MTAAAEWTILNLANLGMLYGRFPTREAAIAAAEARNNEETKVRADEVNRVIEFRGDVRI